MHLRITNIIGLSLAAAALAISGCKKSPPAGAAPQGGSTPPAAAASSAQAPASGLAAHAAKLGFAGKIAKDSEFYFGSANLKAHLDAVKKSAFWKEVSGFFTDKLAAPSGGAKAGADEMAKLWGEGGDAFIALAKGGAGSLTVVRDLSQLYNEVTYHAIMAGGPMSGGAGAMTNPKNFAALLANPDILKRASGIISSLSIPPLIVGFKADKPDEMLKKMFPDEKRAETEKKAKIGSLATAHDGKFTTIELKISSLLTDEVEKEALAGIPETPESAELRAAAAKALDDLQAKTVAFAFGTVAGHVVFAIGPDLSHLAFADQPGASVLAKPELEFVMPHVEKNVALLACADEAVFRSMSTDQPLQPIIRGLVSGLKINPMFAGLAAKIQPQLDSLAATESKLYQYKFSDSAGIGWWDRGLHVESAGGAEMPGFDHGKALNFASALDDPSVIFGINYHRNRPWSALAAEYFEQWMSLIYTVSGELVKAGLAGPQGMQTFEMVDKQVIPPLVAFYQADKDISQNALGDEHALVMDLGGTLEGFMFAPPDGAKQKIPRIAGVHNVANRPLIGQNWAKMDAALKQLLTAIPSPTPMQVPAPLSSEKNGIATFFYPLPYFTEHLMPCASVNDRLFIFGTAKSQSEALAAKLAAAKPAASDTGLRWKVSFANVRELIKSAASMSKGPAGGDEVKQATKWLAPFEVMAGRCWDEGGKRRDSMSWEIHDVTKFD